MLQKKIITSSWGIGLSQAQIALLRETLGDDHELLLHPDFPQGGEKALTNSKEPSPHVIWISSRSGSDLRALPEALAHYQDPAHIVLLLDEGYDINDIEHAFDNGISEIIRPPLTRERIIEIMRRALEMRALHADMDAMTREIVLERELLERKNNILSFLVNFLALTSENTELDTLLCTAFAGFSRLLPLRAMNAVLWDNTEQTPSATLYISANQNSAAYGNWRSALLHHTSLNLGGQFSIQGITALNLEGKTGFA
ncbi:hypothetical protein LJB82_03980, partial [Desulfovibrio sp. OttesenSCG-928-M16]|nr:hypothetical protein [Desulfovibrio sp. OttesenSCG-928-M16]